MCYVSWLQQVLPPGDEQVTLETWRPLILNKLNKKCITLVSLYWYTMMYRQQNIKYCKNYYANQKHRNISEYSPHTGRDILRAVAIRTFWDNKHMPKNKLVALFQGWKERKTSKHKFKSSVLTWKAVNVILPYILERVLSANWQPHPAKWLSRTATLRSTCNAPVKNVKKKS
jgi:hypothetical protein